MVTEIRMQPAVRRYLELFELELKKRSGVVPEEALCDAREYLMSDSSALDRSGEPPNDQEHFQWIVESYGAPEVVAQQYGDQANALPPKTGYAPGWRICCTKCGRSAPLASIGATRIGAKSWHKYILGYCRGCNGLRLMRIIDDLEKSNLTERLGVNQLPEQMRASMHRPYATFFGIFGAVAICLIVVAAIVLTILFFIFRNAA